MPLPAAAPPRTTQPYPAGVAGVKLSIGEMARLMRAARIGPDSDQLRGLAGRALIAAGRPQTIRGQLQVLLDTVRARTVYMPDPVAAEYVVAPAGTLCVRPGLCVPAGDCDDLTTALGALCLVSGINVRIVKQTFGSGDQEHVLIEAQDENGQWIPADPSSDWPVGHKAIASSEVTIEPMDDQQVGMLTNMENNFVGVGGLHRSRFLATRQGLGRITPTGIGSPWLRYITWDVVQSLKDRLDCFVQGLNSDIAACQSIDPNVKSAWTAFYARWQTYYKSTPSWWDQLWSDAAYMDEAEAWETDIQNWQSRISNANCSTGPAVTSISPTSNTISQATHLIQSLVIGVAVVGGVFVLYKGTEYLMDRPNKQG